MRKQLKWYRKLIYVPKEDDILRFVKDNYLIFLIFALGLVLRIYNLCAESIWFDDAFSFMASKKSVL